MSLFSRKETEQAEREEKMDSALFPTHEYHERGKTKFQSCQSVIRRSERNRPFVSSSSSFCCSRALHSVREKFRFLVYISINNRIGKGLACLFPRDLERRNLATGNVRVGKAQELACFGELSETLSRPPP